MWASGQPASQEAIAIEQLLERHGRAAARRLLEERGGPGPALGKHPRDGRRFSSGEPIALVCPFDADFPEPLRHIPDAPLLLYFRGNLAALAAPAVALVGARRASRHGLELARALAGQLAQAGVVVVSGLALGIDGAAHRGALEAEGLTAGVLGSGLDRVAPLSHLGLAERILGSGGVLISEYPPDCPAAPHRFPERNRLISGLCAGVLVIEASERSGSLITARMAGDQGREVMAVPGAPGLPNSAGVNGLLKSGAALVESAGDVLDALGLHRPHPGFGGAEGGAAARLTPEQARLLDFVGIEGLSADELALACGLTIDTCAIRLTELELGGFVQRVGDRYIRRPSGF